MSQLTTKQQVKYLISMLKKESVINCTDSHSYTVMQALSEEIRAVDPKCRLALLVKSWELGKLPDTGAVAGSLWVN